MPQMSLRLVSSRPARRDGGDVLGAPPPVPEGRSQQLATIARLRCLVGARGVPLPPAVAEEGLAPQARSTGLADLDVWLRGWPRQGVVELAGAPGAGRLALVLPLLARLTRQGRPVLFVDPLQQVHPPGLGLVPERVVLVRPPGERAAWAAEQVARSGAVEALVLVDLQPLGRGGVRLARAAEAGGMSVFVLSERSEVGLPASLRLEVGGWRAEPGEAPRLQVRCTRSRDGRMMGERLISLAPAVPMAPRAVEVREQAVPRLLVGRG